MREHDQIADDVLDFVAIKLRVDRASINRGSRLLHDLGVEGDDASELIGTFAEKFGIDVSGFPFTDFFGSEPSLADPLWFLPNRAKLRMRKKALTVEDLIESARLHRWTYQSGE